MYRTAQWIKRQVHTQQEGEAVVMSIRESRGNLVDGEREGQMSPDEEGRRSAGNGENRHILRKTMLRYWVCVIHT